MISYQIVLYLCIKRHIQPSTNPTLSPSSKPSASPSKSPTNKPTPEVCLFHVSFRTLSIPVSHWFTTLSLIISITNSQRTFPLMLPPQDLLHHLLNLLRRILRMSLLLRYVFLSFRSVILKVSLLTPPYLYSRFQSNAANSRSKSISIKNSYGSANTWAYSWGKCTLFFSFSHLVSLYTCVTDSKLISSS